MVDFARYRGASIGLNVVGSIYDGWVVVMSGKELVFHGNAINTPDVYIFTRGRTKV
jgi:hypothetical protein